MNDAWRRAVRRLHTIGGPSGAWALGPSGVRECACIRLDGSRQSMENENQPAKRKRALQACNPPGIAGRVCDEWSREADIAIRLPTPSHHSEHSPMPPKTHAKTAVETQQGACPWTPVQAEPIQLRGICWTAATSSPISLTRHQLSRRARFRGQSLQGLRPQGQSARGRRADLAHWHMDC